jgi:hypothetical protein
VMQAYLVNHIGHCPLSEVQFMYTVFQVLSVLPCFGDWLPSY